MFIHIRWLCVIAIVAVISFGGVTYWMVRRANEAEKRRILEERQRQEEYQRNQIEFDRELGRLLQEEQQARQRWNQAEMQRVLQIEQLNEQRAIRQALEEAEAARRRDELWRR